MGKLPAVNGDTTVIDGTVDVLVDRSGRVGPLSYLVPDGRCVRPGDAVRVPFGPQQRDGVVLGPGDPGRATRELLDVHGKRVTQDELDFAARIAREHLVPLTSIASRLAPRDGKGAEPLDAGELVLDAGEAPARLDAVPSDQRRRLLVCAPLVSMHDAAAHEAARIAESGQVLVLCPTTEDVHAVMARFASGAVRLDADAPSGAWKGFASGTVRVAVGTRVSALYSADDLAGIVVVDESHPGHRERSQPYTHARDLAAARSDHFGTELVLLSRGASVRALGARVKAFPVGSRQDWPEVRIVNARDEDPLAVVPEPALRALARRPSLVVVDDSPVHLCRRCGAHRPDLGPGTLSTEACARCGEESVRQVNWDRHRASQGIAGHQPVTISELRHGEGRAVLLPDFDSALRRPSMQPESWALHVFCEAARAAGRGGIVVLVVRGGHPLLGDLVRRDLLAQARRTWDAAKAERLPPFELWMRVLCAGDNPPATSGWPGRVLGPRRVGKEWEVVVRLPRNRHQELERLAGRLRRRGRARIQML